MNLLQKIHETVQDGYAFSFLSRPDSDATFIKFREAYDGNLGPAAFTKIDPSTENAEERFVQELEEMKQDIEEIKEMEEEETE